MVRRGSKIMFSFPMFREIERGQKVFSGLIGWSFGAATNVEINGVLAQAEVALGSPELLLRVRCRHPFWDDCWRPTM